MPVALPTIPEFTADEFRRAFSSKPYLHWLRDKVEAGAALTPQDVVHLWLVRCRVDESAGRLEEAWQAARHAELLANALDAPALNDTALRGSVLAHLAIVATRQGRYAHAQEFATGALNYLGEHADRVHCYQVLGICALENNHFDQAEEYHLLSAEIARRIGYPLGLAIALHNLAHINLWRGRFDLAYRYASEAHEIQLAQGALAHTYPLHALQIFQIRNQRAEALAALHSFAELATRMAIYEPLVAIFAARLHLDAEDFAVARQEADRAYSSAVRLGMPVSEVLARTVNSRLQRLTGNPVAAIEWAQDALTHARRAGYGYMEAHALIEEGAAHRDNGNIEAAAACWTDATRLAGDLGARHEETHALLLLAALRHSTGHADADELWRRAAQCILDYGYAFLLERERALAFPLVAAYARHRAITLRHPAEQLLGRLAGVAALPLHIHGLGDFVVRRGAHLVDRKALQRRRGGELLRFLLIQPTLRAARDVVIETLWPDLPPGKGQDLLHQATSTLRRALEPDLPDKFPSRYLTLDGEIISVNLPTGSTVDFLEFGALAERATVSATVSLGAIEAALALYQGDLFPDDRYVEWAESPRERYAYLYQHCVLRRACWQLDAGDAQAALRDCRLLLARDHCHEDATLLAMQACMSVADRPAALRFYHKLEQALERDFQLAPREDLMHLAATLRLRKPSP